MEYTLIHIDQFDTETLIRFELLPVQNGQPEIVINEVALFVDGEIIGDSPTVTEQQAKDIVLASDSNEWQQFRLTPAAKYPSPERCEVIRSAFELSGARVIELQNLVARSKAYDKEYSQHTAKHRVLSEAWRKIKAQWHDYYLCGHYQTNPNLEALWS